MDGRAVRTAARSHANPVGDRRIEHVRGIIYCLPCTPRSQDHAQNVAMEIGAKTQVHITNGFRLYILQGV